MNRFRTWPLAVVVHVPEELATGIIVAARDVVEPFFHLPTTLVTGTLISAGMIAMLRRTRAERTDVAAIVDCTVRSVATSGTGPHGDEDDCYSSADFRKAS